MPGHPIILTMMMLILWLLMMLLWLGGLLFGLWWVWPHFERGAMTGDLVMSILWLTTGTLAWLLALNMGRARYWRRSADKGTSQPSRRR